MGAGTKEDNRAFARKMAEQIKRAQENECDSCPHKSTCTWYISEHREPLAAMLAEVIASDYTRRAASAIYKDHLQRNEKG